MIQKKMVKGKSISEEIAGAGRRGRGHCRDDTKICSGEKMITQLTCHSLDSESYRCIMQKRRSCIGKHGILWKIFDKLFVQI